MIVSNNSSNLKKILLTRKPFEVTSLSDNGLQTVDEYYILMPLFSGFIVAFLLLWMIIRYSISWHHNSTIYFCPQKFFDHASICFDCKYYKLFY